VATGCATNSELAASLGSTDSQSGFDGLATTFEVKHVPDGRAIPDEETPVTKEIGVTIPVEDVG
jgi:hypothetical protein